MVVIHTPCTKDITLVFGVAFTRCVFVVIFVDILRHSRVTVRETDKRQQGGHLHKTLFFCGIRDLVLRHLCIRHSVRSCGETQQSVGMKTCLITR